jgi:hypothetical protein
MLSMKNSFIVFDIHVVLVEMISFDLPLLMQQWEFLFSMSVSAKVVLKLHSFSFVRGSIFRSSSNPTIILLISVALKVNLVGS